MQTAEPMGNRHLPGWRAWLTATVVVPLAMLTTCVGLAKLVDGDIVVAILATALVFALIYAVAARVTRLDLWAVLGSYLLAALLAVPWAYGVFVTAFVIGCSDGGCS